MQNRFALPLAIVGLLSVMTASHFFLNNSNALGLPLPVSHQALADPMVSDSKTLNLSDFIEATRLSGNQLAFHDKFEGRPVLMNTDLVSVTKNGDDITVAMQAYQRHDSTLLTSLSTGYPVTCIFSKVTETKPLSSWQPHQEIRLSGKLGTDAETMTDCTLSAYVNANGEPAGLGSIVEVINGQVRKLSRSQTYPPLDLN